MERLSSFVASRPWAGFALAMALALGFAGGIPRLTIDNTTRGLFLGDDPDVRQLADVRANFGPEPDLAVVVRGDDLFGSETLRAARELAATIKAEPDVERVASLFSAEAIRDEELEFDGRTFRRRTAGALVESIPETAAESAELERWVRRNPLLRGTLVGESGGALAMSVFFDGRRADRAETTARIEAAARAFDGPAEAYVFGPAFVEAAMSKSIWRNLLVLGPIAAGVVLLVVFGFFRSLALTAIPLLTGALGAAATLGLMGYLGFALNPLSSTIVVLLFVVGCVEDLRLIAGHGRGIRAGLDRQEAARALGRSVLPASALAALTTFLGFLAVVPNSIPQLREFAIACGAGVAINFAVTVLLVPSLLANLPVPRSVSRGGGALDALAARTVPILIARRRGAIAAFSLAAFVAGIGASRLEIDTNYLRFFDGESEVGRAAEKFFHDFGGASAFAVTVETGRRNGVREWEVFDRLAAFSDELDGHFERAAGAADLVRGVRAWIGADPALPATQAELDETLAVVPPAMLGAFVDHDGSRALVRVRSSSRGSSGMRSDREAVRRIADAVLPAEFEVRVTGEIPILHRISDTIARQLLEGLLLVLGGVFLVLVVAFRSLRLGVAGILPNIFPALATLGVMGWLGIPLSVGTFSISIVALGIGADDTVHFLARFRERLRGGDSPAAAVATAFAAEIRPVAATSAALVAGFLVLGLSTLALHREAAALYAVAFLAALVADLLLLPALLAGRCEESRAES